MKRSPASGQLRWVLAVAFGVVLAAVLIRSLTSSGAVRLLHVGYSKEDNGERAPILCLTNGTSKPIAFSGSAPGGPVWLKEVKTASGWASPRGWHISAGRLQICVLRPGQSVSFRAWSSQNSNVWRAAVKYWPCEIRPSQSTTSGNTFLGFVASRGFRDSDAQPFPGAVVACDRPLMRGVHAKLPKLTPSWLKRYVDSKARDPVAWGPEMKSGTALNELAQRKAN